MLYIISCVLNLSPNMERLSLFQNKESRQGGRDTKGGKIDPPN